MILHEVKIPYKWGDSFTLKPLFDAHVGNRYCDVKALRSYLSDSDDKTYIIGGGDLIDAVITKDIKRYTKASDDTDGDDIIDAQLNKLYDILEPYKERIIGLGTGNHEATITKHHGTNPMRRLAKRMGTVSLGYSWLVRMRFSDNGGRGRTLTIRGHHGWGGGSRTQGADLTKYSKDITYWSADMFLYGHVHRRQSDRVDRLAWIGKRLLSKPKHIFICGTFLKTLSNTDDATYSEEKGYPPVSIGGINIKIRPNDDWLTIEDNA
jgi:hypothetical protein